MAKKKRKKQRPEGYDPNEARRQRLEARRQAKAEAMAARRRQQLRERAIRWVVIAGIAIFSVWFLFFRGQAPDAIAGHEVEHLSLSGGGEHTETAVGYDTSPPVSGPHSQRAAPCGTHGGPLANENLVHTLEHGAVGIVYSPQAAPEEIEEIEALVRSYDSHTFSAPFLDMKTPIAVLAWGHMMRLEEWDEAAAREFIDFFRQGGDSPEAFQDCPNVTRETSTATPTPMPTPSLTDVGGGDGGKDGGGNDGSDRKEDKKRKRDRNRGGNG